jgi:uncharacterized iron-regulated membrane protein
MFARQSWVLVHRWAGLTLALFLTIAGLTGAALAWNDTIEAWTAPRLVLARPAASGATMRDPVSLTIAAQARHPGMMVSFVPLTVEPGHALRLRVAWDDPGHAPDWDELFIDPWSGHELGHRRWGDPGQGINNLMPFLYRLHYSLLLGSWGERVMGLAALVWTLDCVVGFALTLPLRRRPDAPAPRAWLSRWRPAWAVRWHASPAKRNFDLHRAGGLWIWPALMVFAVSSVSLNLPQVYGPALRALGGRDPNAVLAAMALPAPRPHPALDFAAARARGRILAREADPALMPQGAAWLWYVPGAGAYVYGFTTRADIADAGGASRLVFDGDSGRLRAVALARDAPAANRLTDWIVALHMARVCGPVWRIMVSVIGAAVTLLSVTGLIIWYKKRAARIARRRRFPNLSAS